MNKKTVVITGGNRGIGLDITKKFLDAEYFVIVGARTDMDLEEYPDNQICFIKTDVCDESAHIKLVNTAIEKTGKLDVYINNAGYSEWRTISEIDQDFLENILRTNLMSAFWGCKAASSIMKNGGSIINISSIAGKRGSSNNSAYCASKFGMNGMTQSLAKELGSLGIRVNSLCPVLISTDGLVEALESPSSPANGNPEKFISNFEKINTALGRLPTGVEVAAMSLFLASEDASAITGQCINVDCGVFPQ